MIDPDNPDDPDDTGDPDNPDDPDDPDDPVAAAVLLMSDRTAMFTGSSFLSCHFREQYHSIVHKEHTYNPLF